ncbi:hypothetical protein BDV3_000762 [Batrachochytrium dendrobatidis]
MAPAPRVTASSKSPLKATVSSKTSSSTRSSTQQSPLIQPRNTSTVMVSNDSYGQSNKHIRALSSTPKRTTSSSATQPQPSPLPVNQYLHAKVQDQSGKEIHSETASFRSVSHHTRSISPVINPGREAPVDYAPRAEPNLSVGNNGFIQHDQQILDEYEQDFEDYDEDFEEFEDSVETKLAPYVPSDIIDLQRAMQEENNRAAMAQPKWNLKNPMNPGYSEEIIATKKTTDTPPVVVSNLPKRQVVDINVAHQRSQQEKDKASKAQKQAQRVKDLSKLVDLNFTIVNIFDLAPMSSYDLYIRNYGLSNTTQTSTQTNDDCCDRDIQTDDWCVEDKWVQIPSNSICDCDAGTPFMTFNASKSSDRSGIKRAVENAIQKVDSVRLAKFLQRSSQVVDTLLDENTKYATDESVCTSSASFGLSKGFNDLNIPSFLRGQSVQNICFTPGDYRSVLIAWSGVTTPVHPLFSSSQGALIVWRLSDIKRPSRVLVCQSRVTCCCFAPTKPFLVFAGTVDGGVQVWDLREPATNHISATLFPDQDAFSIRPPSYSTDGIYTLAQSHLHPIVSILPLHKYDHKTVEKDQQTNSSFSNSFQLATIDSSGVFQLWVVIELKESAIDLDADLGRRIGSRVKLMGSNSFQMQHPDRHAFSREIEIYDCKPIYNQIDTFLVATDSGSVMHESRFRDRCHPNIYEPTVMNASPSFSLALPRSDKVASISINPHIPSLFLAGHASGMIALYSVHHRPALKVWDTINAPIQYIEWSSHRSAVFVVLDSTGTISVFDLIENDQDARMTVPASDLSPTGNIPCRIAFSPTDVSATSKVSLDNLRAVSSHGATIIVGFDNGSVSVHSVDTEYAEMAIDEEKTMEEYIQELVDCIVLKWK